jgi:hypothetical protein
MSKDIKTTATDSVGVLRELVTARIAYWKAFDTLANGFGSGSPLSDRQDKVLRDAIDTMAAAYPDDVDLESEVDEECLKYATPAECTAAPGALEVLRAAVGARITDWIAIHKLELEFGNGEDLPDSQADALRAVTDEVAANIPENDDVASIVGQDQLNRVREAVVKTAE